MSKQNRVLHIINGMSSGGAETYIMNVYRTIDRSKIQFDFLLRSGNKKEFYYEEIRRKGGRIYFVPSFPKHIYSNYIETRKILKKHLEYQVIELHANALIYIIPLLILKKMKGKKIIVHSHSTKAAFPIYSIIHYINRLFISYLCDEKIACSDNAGRWMFKKGYKIVPNAIDTMRFIKLQDKKVYSEEFIIVNIARFLPVKNHKFMIDIFSSFHDKHKSSVLILIGDGPLKSEIEKKVKELGLESKVIFPGEVERPEIFIANATCFILPSLYEGVPLTLIEAQAMNLHCVVSEHVDSKADITGLVSFVELRNKDLWITKMEEKKHLEQEELEEKFLRSGYDLTSNIRLYERLYNNERLNGE